MTNLIDITDLSDSALDALLGAELTVDTIDADVVAIGRSAIESCLSEAAAQMAGETYSSDATLTHFDCEYIVEMIESVHDRKPTPAECDVLGISSSYALTAYDIEEMNG